MDSVTFDVAWKFFGFAEKNLGGSWSLCNILFWHILINLCVSSLSIYLAVKLSNIGGKKADRDNMVWPLSVIVVTTFVVSIIGKIVSAAVFMSINRNFHDKAIQSLINTKISFFDENTSGRIINRFSKDFSKTDHISFHFLEMLDFMIKCMFSLTIIMIANPITIVIVIV